MRENDVRGKGMMNAGKGMKNAGKRWTRERYDECDKTMYAGKVFILNYLEKI
jgi:hypothetical protein